MPRNPLHTIQVHEEFQPRARYRDFIAHHWAESVGGPLPDTDQATGSVHATINQSRWVVDCPDFCGGAIIASKGFPFFVCHECGSPANGGQWYRVQFPDNADQIEEALLERLYMKHRSWTGETVAQLQDETLVNNLGYKDAD